MPPHLAGQPFERAVQFTYVGENNLPPQNATNLSKNTTGALETKVVVELVENKHTQPPILVGEVNGEWYWEVISYCNATTPVCPMLTTQ